MIYIDVVFDHLFCGYYVRCGTQFYNKDGVVIIIHKNITEIQTYSS